MTRRPHPTTWKPSARTSLPAFAKPAPRCCATPTRRACTTSRPLFLIKPSPPPWPNTPPAKLLPQLRHLHPVLGIHAEDGGRLQVIGEKVPDDFLIVSHAGLLGAMLRAPTVRRHQSSIGARHQVIFPELSYFLEHRVGRLSQELPILRERVVLPEVLCVPDRKST